VLSVKKKKEKKIQRKQIGSGPEFAPLDAGIGASLTPSANPVVGAQRKCAACAEEEKESAATLSRKESDGPTAVDGAPAPPISRRIGLLAPAGKKHPYLPAAQWLE